MQKSTRYELYRGFYQALGGEQGVKSRNHRKMIVFFPWLLAPQAKIFRVPMRLTVHKYDFGLKMFNLSGLLRFGRLKQGARPSASKIRRGSIQFLAITPP